MGTGTTSRRHFLTRSVALGCSLAASPLVTPVTFASAPWENRLVVVILRGGMDGLDVVQPYGAEDFTSLRPNSTLGTDLDGYFALHPALSDLLPLWRAGQLGFCHAVSTPYRDKRSHFDGQDILEAGTSDIATARDGWLNRMMQAVPGVETETAYAIGRSDMLLTRGPAPVANWSPDASLALSPQAERLLQAVMHDDPLFRDAIDEAIMLSALQAPSGAPADTGEMMAAMRENMRAARRGGGVDAIARFAAGRLRGASRIAAFSINGFDTHNRQDRSLPRALDRLQKAILILQQELGPVWEKTVLVAMTEFGRTARFNGTQGTDHGTAGAMVMAGGALRGGRVVTDWPGLSEAALYQRRDLMPTRDIRAHVGWIMRDILGLDRATVETAVFPGVDMGRSPNHIL